MLKHGEWSEGSKKYVIEDDKKEFNRMYPEVDYDGKYILWLEISFLWKYKFDSMQTEIHIHKKDGTEYKPFKYQTRHIYPNRGYHTICLKNNRRLCNEGIVLYFDTFEELSSIDCIDYVWKINYNNTKEYSAVFHYELNFAYEKGKNIYGMTMHDVDIGTISEDLKNDNSVFKNKLDEYQDVFIINQKENEEKSDIYIMKDSSNNIEGNSLQALLIYNNGLKNLVDNFEQNNDFRIECFFAKETLIPDICSPA